MEPFDIGLDGEEMETSPDFDDLPAEPPKNKIRRQKSTAESSLSASCSRMSCVSRHLLILHVDIVLRC